MKHAKKLLALLLCLAMVLSVLPMSVLAAQPAEDEGPIPESPAGVASVPLPEEEAPEALPPEPAEPNETYTGTCGDNLNWNLNTSTGILAITGTGAMTNYANSDDNRAPWYDYRTSIKKVDFGLGVTSIGNYAFSNCTKNASVTYSSTITSIGSYAFKSNYALLSLTIPDTVTTVGNYAFQYCQNATDVYVGKSLKSLGANTFAGCSAVTEYQLHPENTNFKTIDGALYNYSTTSLYWYPPASEATYLCTPNETTVIGPNAIGHARNLVAIDLPGVTALQSGALMYCTGLTEISCPNVKTVGVQAFDHCSSLQLMAFGPNLTNIYSNAFSNCTALTKIAFNCSAPSFGSTPFSGVTATVFYPTGDDTWTSDKFQDYGGTLTWTATAYSGSCGTNLNWSLAPETGIMSITGTGAMTNYTGYYNGTDHYTNTPWDDLRDWIQLVNFSDGATSVGNSAFYYCPNLRCVIFNNGMKTVGRNAFEGCSQLWSITFSDAMTSIGFRAFAGCSAIVELRFGTGLTKIEQLAFTQCTGVTEIRFTGSAPSIHEQGFSGVTATAYYPVGDSSWTADMLQDYSGDLTWKAYGLWVCGVLVTNDNAADVLGDDKVHFNTGAFTLTVENRSLNDGSWTAGEGYAIYSIGMDLNLRDTSGILRLSAADSEALTAKGVYCEGELRVECGIECVNAVADIHAEAINIWGDCSECRLNAAQDILVSGDYSACRDDGRFNEPAINGCDITLGKNVKINTKRGDGIFGAQGDNDTYGDVSIGGDLTICTGGYNQSDGWGIVTGGNIVVNGSVDADCGAAVLYSMRGEVRVNGTFFAETNAGPEPMGKYIFPYANGTPIIAMHGNVILNGSVKINTSSCVGLFAGEAMYLNGEYSGIRATEAAVLAHADLSIPDNVSITLPAGGVVRRYTIEDAEYNTIETPDENEPAQEVILQANDAYDLWVGKTVVTDRNKGDVLGDGKVSFNPNTNTLTLNGELTVDDCGVYSITPYQKALIYAKGMDMVITDPSGTVRFSNSVNGDKKEFGFYCESAGVTVDGNLEAVCGDCCIYSDGEIQINGDADVRSPNYHGPYGDWSPGPLTAHDEIHVEGDLTAIGNNHFCAFTYKDIIVGGDVYLENPCPAGGRGISVYQNIDISGNVTGVCSHAVLRSYAGGGDIYVEGNVDITTTKAESDWQVGKFGSYYPYNYGSGILSDGAVTINGDVTIHSAGNIGIYAKGELSLTQGTSDITATEAAILVGSLNYEPCAITLPTGGSLLTVTLEIGAGSSMTEKDFVTVAEADGTTPAAHVILRNEDEILLWVDGVPVTEGNCGDIFGDGLASFNPNTNTLTINKTKLTGVHSWMEAPDQWSEPEKHGAVIYADARIGHLTINIPNGLTLSNSEGGNYDFAIYMKNGTLTVNGNLTAEACASAIEMINGDLTVNGSLDLAGYFNALRVYGSLQVNGSLEATSHNTAVYARDALTVTGDLSLNSDTCGAYHGGGGDMTVGGNLVCSAGRGIESNANIRLEGDVTVSASDSCGILALGTLYVGSGSWDVTGSEYALVGADGIVLPAASRIILPVGGVISTVSMSFPDGKYTRQVCAVTEADGTTPAAHVQIGQLADGYYLIGQKGWTVDTIDPAKCFAVNPANANEYLLSITLTEGDPIKVVHVANGAIDAWYPDGEGAEYTVDADHAGEKTIYFKTSYDNAWADFGGYFYIEANPVGPTDPILENNFVIYSSATIGIEVYATFGVRKEVMQSYDSWYIEVKKLDEDGTVTESKRFGAGQDGEIQEGYICNAKYTDITAKEFGVTMEVSVHAFEANGQEHYSAPVSYTMQEYIIDELLKADNSVAMRALAADLLNYGAAAQVYFDYETEHLVNHNLSTEAQAAMDQFASTGEAPADLVNGSNGPNVYGSVSVKNRIVLSMTVRDMSSFETMKVRIKNHEDGSVKDTIDAKKRGSVWVADYDGFEAEDMRTLYDFVPVADGEETGTPLTWSVEGYAREARLNPDATAAELKLFNALLHYVDAVKAAFPS